MKLVNYFEEIESLPFQIQFSVLSGISVVKFALSRNATVTGLLDLLQHETCLAEDLYHRIRYLLPLVATESNLSYDESIVTYLYCLNKIDPLLAYRASAPIWDTEGLLWSRWLAFNIMEFVQQVEQSLDVSSAAGESQAFSVAEQQNLVDSRSPVASSHRIVTIRRDRYTVRPAELSLVS